MRTLIILSIIYTSVPLYKTETGSTTVKTWQDAMAAKGYQIVTTVPKQMNDSQ